MSQDNSWGEELTIRAYLKGNSNWQGVDLVEFSEDLDKLLEKYFKAPSFVSVNTAACDEPQELLDQANNY